MPCDVCRDLCRFDKEIAGSSLIQSALGDCSNCQTLKQGVDAFFGPINDRTKLQLILDVTLLVRVLEDGVRGIQGVVEFYSVTGEQSLWPKVGRGRHVSRDSSDDETIALAKKWLIGCLESHEECRHRDKPWLPTRVIDVGTSDDNVRLFTDTEDLRADYVALSHCWGSGRPLTLKKNNLEALKTRIELGDNSKTFKEAISLTRRLGIPYLWIDSLCILQDQDDLSDWETENPRMGELYNSATVVVGAASSTDTAGGLFPRSEDREDSKKVLKLFGFLPDDSLGTIYVRQRHNNVFDKSETTHCSSEAEKPHLASRGWTLQESQLGARILNFRKEEMTWSCSTYSRCECRIRPWLSESNPFRSPAGTDADEDTLAERTRLLNLQWPGIVMEFTRRDLTNVTDRIAALSGLANYMEQETTDSYFCGLWYEDLAFQLLWFVLPEDIRQSRHEKPYAPSWSWSSVRSAINYAERWPIGSAPRHAYSTSDDAVRSVIHVNNVGRLPVSWDNVYGPTMVAPMLIVAYTIPVYYDSKTCQWLLSEVKLQDYMPEALRVYYDCEDDRPEKHPDSSHMLILAGQWKAEGHTIAALEAVCILARRMISSEENEEVQSARDMQKMAEEKYDQDMSGKPMPELETSYKRVGLARGAGSFDAWEATGIEMSIFFLF